jgi:DNA-binding transcriptional regulator YiaG
MYHYKSCGLENIYLKNGFTLKETPYGPAVSIEDIEGLHMAIAADLLGQNTPLTGAQFRFLRKEQDLTQAALAAILGVSEQTVAAWEKQKDAQVQHMADIAIRAYYLAHRQASSCQQTFPVAQEAPPRQAEFSHEDDGWVAMAA